MGTQLIRNDNNKILKITNELKVAVSQNSARQRQETRFFVHIKDKNRVLYCVRRLGDPKLKPEVHLIQCNKKRQKFFRHCR